MGDHPGPPIDSVVVYDSTTDQWADGPSLPEPRGGGGFVRIGRVLHYVSGYSEREVIAADHWALDLDGPGTWQPRAPVPMPRGHVAVAVLGDKLYFIGGMLGHDAQPADQAEVQVYSPEDDSWSVGPTLPTPRSHAEAGTLTYGDRILSIGGRNRGLYSRFGPVPHRMDQNLPNIAVLDPERGWSEAWSLPLGLRGASAGIVDGVLIVAGGSVFMGSHGQAGVFTLPISALLQ